MSSTVKIAYWNALAKKNIEAEQIDYYHALQEEYEPDILFITECREPLASELTPYKYGGVDYSPCIKDRRHGWEGIAVITRFALDQNSIRREQSWYGNPIKNKLRYDARELVCVKTPTDKGPIDAMAGHIIHPHHLLQHPSFNLTRPKQWRFLRDKLIAEERSFVWLADTNTLFRRSVNTGLEPSRTGAVLLPHTGEGNQRTWRPIGPVTGTLQKITGIEIGEVLTLDRAAVSSDLAEHSDLTTLPNVIAGVVNPSDHRAILLSIDV